MIQIFLKMKEQYIKTEMEYPLNFWLRPTRIPMT